MRLGNVFQRYERVVAAAVIGAHASSASDGFRQREVRFLIELFSNWVEQALTGTVIELSNTQIARYLTELAGEGFVRRTQRKKLPFYRLTRTGLIELLSRISAADEYVQPEFFFFSYYFLLSYKDRLHRLIEAEGKQFPLALRLEVESLLDAKTLPERQLSYAERELEKLEVRINDAAETERLARKLFAAGADPLTVGREVEKRYPYELNSQKPLSELLAGLPADFRQWELETGTNHRVKYLWAPIRAQLKSYIETLRTMTRNID